MSSRSTTPAANITDGVNVLNTYLAENDLPHPSFDANGPADLQLSSEVEDTVLSVLNSTLELCDLLRGPKESMLEWFFWRPWVVYDVIRRFSIAAKIPVDGEASYADLAVAPGINEDALTRILRYGLDSSSAIKLLAEDALLNDMVQQAREDCMASSLAQADALEKWPAADEPSEVTYLLGENSTQTGFFAHIAQDPERAERFARSMSHHSKGENIAEDYDWGSLGSATIVDIGGSTGEVAFKIANQYPNLKVIVQDLPEYLKAAKVKDLGNVSFMAHDFFKDQPVAGASVYYLRWVFHDWHDKYGVKILRALIPALRPGTKVLIVQAIVPPFGVLPNLVERRLRGFDTAMLAFMNAKERTLDEWKNMIRTADARFQFEQVIPLKNSLLSVIELVWAP
ncbi:hypothetical protein LTR37_014844 [Vermiconidia calcicola]|uniref:Uncharacterized protein n=1 Tax=Vermiconidia calcicola TaxID=1690605 RepID=A0ACC3MT28_9PEZI|nr:hypothetical protein LTR37_014844 [Vermiconidia calcicola]